MRQLGGDQLEHQPVRHDPAQQEPHRRAAAPDPHERDRHGREQRARPERHREHQQVVAERQAVRLLAGRDLAEEVGAHGALEEQAVAAQRDRHAPGQHDQQHQRQTPGGAQPAPPAHAPLHQRQRQRRAEGRDQHHRPLQHQPDPERCPVEQGDPQRGPPHGVAVAPGAQQRGLQRHDRRQQAAVDGGEPPFCGHQHRQRQQQRAQQPGGGAEQRSAHARRQQHRQHHRQQGRQPVGPCRALVQRAGRGHGGGFQPVDPGRLQVARLVLEPHVDEVARAQHLRRRFHVARLVAVERRQAGPPRQEQGGRQGQDQRDVPEVEHRISAGRGPVGQRCVSRAGTWVRDCSQITPAVSRMPTSARCRLVYFELPCRRARWRTG